MASTVIRPMNLDDFKTVLKYHRPATSRATEYQEVSHGLRYACHFPYRHRKDRLFYLYILLLVQLWKLWKVDKVDKVDASHPELLLLK